jgi:hypothetical protein
VEGSPLIDDPVLSSRYLLDKNMYLVRKLRIAAELTGENLCHRLQMSLVRGIRFQV